MGRLVVESLRIYGNGESESMVARILLAVVALNLAFLLSELAFNVLSALLPLS